MDDAGWAPRASEQQQAGDQQETLRCVQARRTRSRRLGLIDDETYAALDDREG
jgi:hypothetical protein